MMGGERVGSAEKEGVLQGHSVGSEDGDGEFGVECAGHGVK